MKKLIFLLCMISAGSLLAQNLNKDQFRSPGKLPLQFEEGNNNASSTTPNKHYFANPVQTRGANAINPIAIGESGNAWGFAYMRTCYLWANNDINSISFIHRMQSSPGTGYLAYDISKDKGMNWSVNNQVYDPTIDDAANGRYPQGAIYNPAGNTDPDNAYFTYFAPTLDGSNGIWGGYGWGTSKLAEGSPAAQATATSGGGFYNYLPSGFTITQLGETWTVDEEQDGETGDFIYTNNLIVGHGIWNDGEETFDYTFEHKELIIDPEAGINDVKVAFSPDGMTGWICALTNLEDHLDGTWYHPVFFKTTDGGATWTDEPIEVQLGGEDGFAVIRNYITDERLQEFYDGDVPPRDEIPYFMGYHMDLAVDAWGNPHIMGLVGICDLEEQSWYNGEGLIAMIHIYSTDAGNTWEAFKIDEPKTFDNELTGGGSDMKMYNRPQVGTTQDGTMVFFSFLDTRIDGVTDNNNPDIFFRDYNPATNTHGDEVINVTLGSNAMWVAYFACMSHYVFSEETEAGIECTIPFVYEELTNMDISEPVQFWYIPNFKQTYMTTGIAENPEQAKFTVSQSYPSPCSDQTNFNINVLSKSNIEVKIFNSVGQLLQSKDFGTLNNGPHKITLDLPNLNRGIYLYSVSDGRNTINGKLIVD